jgi:hypothetical protein
MSDRSTDAPRPTQDLPPAAFARGSGRHRADTMQIPVVPAAEPDPAQPSPASAPSGNDARSED